MQALGMIEVYGYVAAVEALDSALKAAQVSLVDVVQVKGGLVTVLFSGDVGAVKAAVDASQAAAGCVGQVVGAHVIPRPAKDVGELFMRESDPHTEQPKGSEEAIISKEELAQMTVAQLRKLARESGLVSMTREEIRFARKQDLITAIMKCRQEN